MFRSDLIPHNQFHTGYWYKSNLSNWYYFKEQSREFKINPSFDYISVDKNLQNLVKLFHSKGIPTTPSCSGHSLPDEYFKDLYKTIKIQETIIRTIGLELTNVETNEKVRFKNENYKFLYSEELFLKLVQPYSKRGVLGVLGDFSYIDKVEDLEVEYLNGITLFSTKGYTEAVWKHLEQVMQGIW